MTHSSPVVNLGTSRFRVYRLYVVPAMHLCDHLAIQLVASVTECLLRGKNCPYLRFSLNVPAIFKAV